MGKPTVLYHPIHARGPDGMLFDSDDLPDMNLGWHTDWRKFPDKIPKAHQVPLEVAVAAAPKSEEQIAHDAQRVDIPTLADPHGFKSFEEYMEEFDSRLSTSLNDEQRDEQHKRAVQHYAIVSYQCQMENGIPLVDMVNQVDILEAEKGKGGANP